MSTRARIRSGRSLTPAAPAPASVPTRAATPSYEGAPLPANASQETLAALVQSGRQEACGRYLGGRADVDGLLGLMRETARAWDQVMAQFEFDPPIVCKPGCDACCYNPISLTPPEALFLGLVGLESFDADRRDQISRRTDEVLGHMRGRSRAEWGAIRHLLACPLLEQGACLLHQSRPLVCRGWNAVNAEQCRATLADRDPQALIENHPLPRLLADHFQLGLLDGVHGLGLEAGYLALPRALRLMLDHGVVACAEEWLRGGPFFGRLRRG